MRITALRNFIRTCTDLARDPGSDVRLPLLMSRSAMYHLRSRRIYAGKATIRGIQNIETPGTLSQGTPPASSGTMYTGDSSACHQPSVSSSQPITVQT